MTEPEYVKYMREASQAKVTWFVIGAFTTLAFALISNGFGVCQ